MRRDARTKTCLIENFGTSRPELLAENFQFLGALLRD